jgi:CRISPR-associated protein Csb2
MFALEVEYLTGRAVAAELDDHELAEWPPHPGRLFSALVAAHAERDPSDIAERAALLWLETQPPPAVSASTASRREVLTTYVPVNDSAGPSAVPRKGFTPQLIAEKIRVLPERRSRQPRTFPSVTPAKPRVVFTWPDAGPAEVARHRVALERMAATVTYLGHSSSLVRVASTDDLPPPKLLPSDEGTRVLRVPTPGRLDELLAAHAAGRRPSAGFYAGYVEADDGEAEKLVEGGFGRPIVFQLVRPGRFPLVAAPRLTDAVRNALMSMADQPPQEILSGHASDGSPSTRDHVAILPLAFVGHEHADGSLKGFAVTVPRDVRGEERNHVLRALGRLDRLRVEGLGAWSVERVTGSPALSSLESGYYEGPALTWATVTPMVFDRFPKKRPGGDAMALVAAACRRIGLPDPAVIEVSHVSRHAGVPPSPEFRLRSKTSSPPRPYWHVHLGFDQPVRGPVVLGSGRYLGLGLFRSCDGRTGGRRWP